MKPSVLALATLLLLGACAEAQSRFEPAIATALRRDPMRRLETERLVIYYPEGRRDIALRTADRVEGCTRELMRRAQIKNSFSTKKMVLVMPEVVVNNAFAFPTGGGEAMSLIPTYGTADTLSEMGEPLDAATVGCHEFVHYVQMLQVAGFWRATNFVFGEVVTPQLGLDAWFIEGLATYYESVLQPGSGRMGPMYDGFFHAGVAGRRLGASDLASDNRLFSMQYLVGSRFIEYLVERYGEERLWRLIKLQGESVMFPLAVNVRFWRVYDKSLSTLVEEFSAHVAARYPERPRSPEQRVVRRLGTDVRYAVSRNGTEALVTGSVDEPVRLEIHAADGRLLRRRNLSEVLLPRRLVSPHPSSVSGLSFTSDGQQLFFAVVDQGATFSPTKLVRYDVQSDRLSVVHADLGGPGGAVEGGGRSYYFSRADGDRYDLMALDLATGGVSVLAKAAPGSYLSDARPSPDGRRLLATHWRVSGSELVLLDLRAGGAPVPINGTGGSVLSPAWIDDQRLVWSGESRGENRLMVHDLARGSAAALLKTPYLAMWPQVRPDGNLRFMNREGWRWSLDEVRLPRLSVGAPLAAGDQGRLLLTTFQPGPGGMPASPEPPVAVAASATPVVASDRPYSGWERLLVPQLRWVDLMTTAFGAWDGRAVAAAAVGGQDRLSYHSWVLSGALDLGTRQASFGFGYANALLAPLMISASVSQEEWTDELEDGAVPGTVDRFVRQASLKLSRAFFTHAAGLTLGIEDDRRGELRRKLGRAEWQLSLRATEGTPYGGARRGFAFQATAAAYPEGLNSFNRTFTDLSSTLTAVAPIPGLRRPSFKLSLTGRGIFGLPAGSRLLQVGGLGGTQLFRSSNRPDGPETQKLDSLPESSDRFIERLRGFEDHALSVDRVAHGEATFRFPVIIDKGVTSTLGVLPSSFLQQLNLEAFASGAWDTEGQQRANYHAAVGAAASLQFRMWVLPASLGYQLSHRLLDDRATVHLVTLRGGS